MKIETKCCIVYSELILNPFLIPPPNWNWDSNPHDRGRGFFTKHFVWGSTIIHCQRSRLACSSWNVFFRQLAALLHRRALAAAAAAAVERQKKRKMGRLGEVDNGGDYIRASIITIHSITA